MTNSDRSIKWTDSYFKSKERTVLTQNEIRIPGIRLFAMHKIHNAIRPLRPHYHENAFEFTFIDKGCMSFSTGSQDYEVSGGCVFLSFPNETHSTNNIPITLNEQYWFQLDISDPKNFLYLNTPAAQDYIDSLKNLEHLIPLSDVKQFRSIIKHAFDLALGGGSHYLIAGYFIILLQMLISSKESSHHTYPDIENAVQYIEAHITEDISLESLSSRYHLSTSHFKQKFRNVIGTSPRNYINQRKIEYSKPLLLSGQPITAVAMNLGFNTSSYFSSVFKKYTLLSPREYKKNHQSQ